CGDLFNSIELSAEEANDERVTALVVEKGGEGDHRFMEVSVAGFQLVDGDTGSFEYEVDEWRWQFVSLHQYEELFEPVGVFFEPGPVRRGAGVAVTKCC